MNYGIGLMTSFADYFSKLSIAAFFCIVVGLMLIIIDLFQSQKGILFGCGFTLSLSGMVMRLIVDFNFGVMYIMMLCNVIVIFIVHLSMLNMHKKQWLLQALNIAVAGDNSTEVNNYSRLVNLVGVATTDINTDGNMGIDDINYFVYSHYFIEKGSKVSVIKVDNDKIYVEKFDETSVRLEAQN